MRIRDFVKDAGVRDSLVKNHCPTEYGLNDTCCQHPNGTRNCEKCWSIALREVEEVWENERLSIL